MHHQGQQHQQPRGGRGQQPHYRGLRPQGQPRHNSHHQQQYNRQRHDGSGDPYTIQNEQPQIPWDTHHSRPPPPPPRMRTPPSETHSYIQPTEEERKLIDKVAENFVYNPSVVDMLIKSHGRSAKYAFLFKESPLYGYYQWRIRQIKTNNYNSGALNNMPQLPPGLPPPPPTLNQPRTHRPPPPPPPQIPPPMLPQLQFGSHHPFPRPPLPPFSQPPLPPQPPPPPQLPMSNNVVPERSDIAPARYEQHTLHPQLSPPLPVPSQFRPPVLPHLSAQPPPYPPHLPPPIMAIPAQSLSRDHQHGNVHNDISLLEPESTEADLPRKKGAKQYYELPAGIIMRTIGAENEELKPYDPIKVDKIEDAEFLESIIPGLSTEKMFPDNILTLNKDVIQALEHFDDGVRYIFKEGEYEYRDDPFAIEKDTERDADSNIANKSHIVVDREGWEPGVLEKVLWERRKGQQERKKWKQAQKRIRRSRGIKTSNSLDSESESISSSNGSSSSESLLESSSESSSSDSESDSGSDSDSELDTKSKSKRNTAATSINKAIGSENVGYKLLEKLGWQKGQSLGSTFEGIKEPIRPSTRFGNTSKLRRTSHSINDSTNNSKNSSSSDKQFEIYRKQMSSSYKKGIGSRSRHNRNK